MPRKTAAVATAERASVKRDEIARAAPAPAPEPAPPDTAPAPVPTLPPSPIVRQTIEGEGHEGPTYSTPVRVPAWADFIGFSFVRQSGPGAVVLQASNEADAVEWAQAPYQRPPQPGLLMGERLATPEERRSAIYNTRMTVTVPLPGPPPPRWPQYVRVAALVSVNADTVIEFREGA